MAVTIYLDDGEFTCTTVTVHLEDGYLDNGHSFFEQRTVYLDDGHFNLMRVKVYSTVTVYFDCNHGLLEPRSHFTQLTVTVNLDNGHS